MKKFLSLVLALIMTMSLVTVSAGAKDFTDGEKINYEEAVAVMSAVKVLDGYADGSFKPQGELTRGAAAKIICNMILGPTTASELHADTAPYKDVAVDHTFAGYIAYCAKEGIISGYADGTFRPAAPLTGYAFMKMLLGALGYDQNVEGFTGANWSINVAKRALGIGLNAGLKTEFSGIKSVTREEAALYAFNALQADLVEYDSKTTVTVAGAEVVIAGSEAKAQRWNNSATKIENIKKDNYIQFAEQYFTKLTCTDGSDVFGRPANVWTYNKTDIGTFVDYTLLAVSYTTGVKGGKIYDAIGSVASKFDLTFWQDGVAMDNDATAKQAALLKKNNATSMDGTGNGVLTEVYVDQDAEKLTIVQVNTYLAKATSDYNAKKETLSVTTYGNKASVIYLDDVASIVDVKADDYLLVNIADGVIVDVMEPETIEDSAITKFSVSGNKPSYVVTGGEQYDSAETLTLYPDDAKESPYLGAYNQDALKNFTYDVFVDQYGYAIGIVVHEGTAQYLFLVGYDKPSSNLAISTADAAVIFTDGNMKKVEIDFKETNKNIAKDENKLVAEGESHRNEWFKYTEDDGVYELTEIDNTATLNISAKRTSLNCENARIVDSTDAKNVAYGNDDSVYITVKAEAGATDINGTKLNGDAITKVTGTYTGVQDIDLTLVQKAIGEIEDVVYAVYNSDKYIIAAVVIGEDNSNTTGYAYGVDGAQSESYVDGYYYWDFKAIVEGEVKTLTVKTKYTAVIDAISAAVGKSNIGTPALMKLTYDADGEYVIGAQLLDETSLGKLDPQVDVDKDNIYSDTDYKASEDIDPAIFKAYQVELKNVALTESGRTLYTDESIDVGLTIVSGAPIVVIQKDAAGKLSVIEYSTFKSALTSLEDSEKFTGVVAAKLNSKGTAEWVVIESATQLTETKKDEQDASNIDSIVYADGKLTLTLDKADNTKAQNFDVTLYIVNGGQKVAIDTYRITVAKGEKTGEVTIGTLTAGQQFQVVCGTYKDLFTGAAAAETTPAG